MSGFRLSLLSLTLLVGAASPGVAAELQIVNSSGQDIHELYLAPPGVRTWGPDRLRAKRPSVIARGETHTLVDVAPGTYQLMLADADGRECQIDAIAITATYRLDLTSRRLRECIASN